MSPRPAQRPSNTLPALPGAAATGAIRFVRALGRMGRDENGGVAITFAMALVGLCLFVGAAVDIGRWVQARHQTIVAMDAAVLAGGRVLQIDEQDVDGARAAALAYYQENTKQRAEVVDDTITFDAADDKSAFVSTGNAFLKTTFLNLANVPRLPLLNTAKAEYSRAELTGGGPGSGGGGNKDSVEIALMLDVTGSMSGNKIKELKTAAKDLINIVISDSVYARPTRVALIPFSEGVKLSSSAFNKARDTSLPNSFKVGSGWNSTTYYRTDCVVERTGAEKYTDAAPGANKYATTLYKPNSWGGASCPLGSDEELFPLSNDKTTLKSRIDNLDVSGSTGGQIGTAWAWYTLSPNWNSLWDAASAAAAYGPKVNKIAILMTDGEYNIQYASNGVSASAYSAANGSSSSQAVSLCSGMKTAGITVYTIGFALGGNQSAINTLKSCASDDSKAYTVDTGSELQQAFREIALKISPLYLSH